MDPDNSIYRIAYKNIQSLENKKKLGNDAFSAGRIQEAYDLYTEALSIDPDNVDINSTLYCNRAAALIKVIITI